MNGFEVPYTAAQRELFKRGDLFDQWVDRHPGLFDDQDQRIVRNQRCYPSGRGYHFFECLVAVVLRETCGYLSLLEKYETPSHAWKYETFRRIAPRQVVEYTLENRAGAPDLFSYDPVKEDWFFCEVKGGPDRLGPKQRRFIDFMNEAGFGRHMVVASVTLLELGAAEATTAPVPAQR